MGFWGEIAKVAGSAIEKAQKDQARKMKDFSKRAMSEGKSEPKIGEKTLREWENSWEYLGILSEASLSHLSNSVGLYRAKLEGKIVYIGRAIEYDNGGFRKRLSDYTRESDSARSHSSGQLMHKNASKLIIDILITGQDEDAVEVTKKLEQYFIGIYTPEWNKMFR